jgi:glycosyltransferase involved in cell wall biosynthesis
MLQNDSNRDSASTLGVASAAHCERAAPSRAPSPRAGRAGTILMDGRYLGPRASGIGRYHRELALGMQRLRPELAFRFIVRRHGDESPLKSGGSLEFDHAPYGPFTSLSLGRRLHTAGSADVFHSPFHVLPRTLACPAVVTMHDAFQFEQLKTSNYPAPVSWAEWAYFLWAIPETLQRARRIVCVSQTTADEVLRHVPTVRDKVRVVPHGVTALFRRLEDRGAVARRCATLVGSPEPFVLAIGGVSPNKNHERTLRAFAAAFPEGSPVRFALVTRFGSSARLVALARELGVSDRYVPLGSPSDRDLVTLLNGAAVLSFCSTVEGFGLPILEAMACGCPVLTSLTSCMPEIAGNAALLADPYSTRDMASKLRAVLNDAHLREELSEKGLQRARGFTWEKAARATLEVYDECLAGA